MTAMDLINEERDRQVAKGYDSQHDDQLVDGELANGAATLADAVGGFTNLPCADHAVKKHRDPIKRLVIAGALIVAEIERLQRLQAKGQK